MDSNDLLLLARRMGPVDQATQAWQRVTKDAPAVKADVKSDSGLNSTQIKSFTDNF